MQANRYMACKFLRAEGQLIPFWLLDYKKDGGFDNDYPKYIYNNIEYTDDHFIDHHWDLKKKQPKEISIINLIPIKTNFVKDNEYLVEVEYRVNRVMGQYQLSKLIDITYDKYSTEFKKGKRIEKHETDDSLYNVELINPDVFYEVRTYSPTYVFENGFTTTYEHQIKHLI